MGVTLQMLEQILALLDTIAGAIGIGEFATKQMEQRDLAAERLAQQERSLLGFRYLAGGRQAADEILERMRETSSGGIDDATLMAMANEALRLGVTRDAEMLAQLLSIASIESAIGAGPDAGTAAATAGAFDEIVTAIARLDPQRLKELGLTVDAEQAYAAYAGTLPTQSGVAHLMDADKQQALLQAVLADPITKALVGLPEFQAVPSQRREAKRASDELVQSLRPPGDPFAEFEAQLHLMEQSGRIGEEIDDLSREALGLRFQMQHGLIAERTALAQLEDLRSRDKWTEAAFQELEASRARFDAIMEYGNTATLLDRGDVSSGPDNKPMGWGCLQAVPVPPWNAGMQETPEDLAQGVSGAWEEATNQVVAGILRQVEANIQAGITPEVVEALALRLFPDGLPGQRRPVAHDGVQSMRWQRGIP